MISGRVGRRDACAAAGQESVTGVGRGSRVRRFCGPHAQTFLVSAIALGPSRLPPAGPDGAGCGPLWDQASAASLLIDFTHPRLGGESSIQKLARGEVLLGDLAWRRFVIMSLGKVARPQAACGREPRAEPSAPDVGVRLTSAPDFHAWPVRFKPAAECDETERMQVP
jgi:hypothetical protein